MSITIIKYSRAKPDNTTGDETTQGRFGQFPAGEASEVGWLEAMLTKCYNRARGNYLLANLNLALWYLRELQKEEE